MNKIKNIKLSRKISKNKLFLRKYLASFLLIIKIIIFLVVATVIIYFLFFSNIFKVKNINISGLDQFVNKDDVATLARTNLENKNIFIVQIKNLNYDLKNNFLGAKEFIITKKLPNTVDIEINERTPTFIVFRNENEDHFLVDEDGYVLGKVDPDTSLLPKIKYDKDIIVGKFIDKNLAPLYTELTSYLKQEDVKASSISFHQDYVLFYIDGGQEILIGNNKNKLEAIKTIDALIKQSKLENKEIKRIDLRFDKVIVLFK